MPGVYEVELIVRDALGNVSVARVAITVVARGDCDGDLHVDAADLAALAAELFDGDGPDAAAASGGSFAGDAVGCDANADDFITAADLAGMSALLVQ